MFNHKDNSSCSYIPLICLSPSLTYSYWWYCSFVDLSHRQPTFGVCQNKAAVTKHLITACRDSQDWHSWQSLKCLCSPTIFVSSRYGETVTKKIKIGLILRHLLGHASVQVIPNLSQFSGEGDNRADALCRLAVITDGISVRVWMCMISGFRLSKTPVTVLKTRAATSEAEKYV